MKRWKKILLAVLALIAVLIAGLAWWQWENLQAVNEALQSTPEEIETKLEENKQAIKDAVDAAPEVVIRDVTEEEKQALKDGTLSEKELADRLVQDAVQPAKPKPQSQPVKPPGQPAEAPPETPPQELPPEEVPEEPEVDPEYQAKVSAIVAEVYVLREKYTIELDNMYAEAKATYKAMSEKERTKSNLVKVAKGYISRASALENACDDQMDAIVAEMTKLISENNGDMSLVDTVVYTYASEKSLKKAWYMSELEKRGLI